MVVSSPARSSVKNPFNISRKMSVQSHWNCSCSSQSLAIHCGRGFLWIRSIDSWVVGYFDFGSKIFQAIRTPPTTPPTENRNVAMGLRMNTGI
jgi:hypothetical protein